MRYFFLFFIIFFLSSCVKNIPTPQERVSNTLSLVNGTNFSKVDIKTEKFTLFSLQNKNQNCVKKDLKIYIEGDGLSWISRTVISKDPTPTNPIALKLMNEEINQCKVYLARPCQFVNSTICEEKYWTSHRFSKEVINSFDEVLNILKKEYKNSTFTLVGYSGGGAVASLVASKRDDINMLVTVAGNLDIEKWTSMYNLSPLDGSLNPADFSQKLQNINQYHLIGKEDKVIPKDIFLSYYSKFEKKDKIKYGYFEANHECCWEEIYKSFLK